MKKESIIVRVGSDNFYSVVKDLEKFVTDVSHIHIYDNYVEIKCTIDSRKKNRVVKTIGKTLLA